MKLDRQKDRQRVGLVLVERTTGTDKLRRETKEGLEISEDKSFPSCSESRERN